RSDLRECLRTRTVIRREVDHRYIASGAVRRLVLTIVPLRDDVAVLHTEDVTDQRAAEHALRESERKYRTIIDTANDGVWAVDAEERATYGTERMRELVAYRVDEMIGRPSLDFIDDRQHEAARAAQERRRSGTKEQFDFELRRRDGSPLWVAVSAALVDEIEG